MENLSDDELMRRYDATNKKGHYLMLHLLNISYAMVGRGCRYHTEEQHRRLKLSADKLNSYADACYDEYVRRYPDE